MDTDQPFADLPNPMKRTDVFRTINEARHIGDTGDDEQAIRMLDPLLEEEPRNPVLLQNLGRSLVRAGRYGRAVEILKRYVEVAPGDPESTLQLGHAYVARGEPGKAVEYIERSLELMPVYGEAWDELCVARAQLGRLDAAVEAGRRAVELEPANQQYRANLGVALMQQGKTGEALRQFDAGLRYNDASSLLQYHRGLALRALERFEDAAEAFKAAVQSRPDHVHARLHLVELAFRTGDEQTVLRHGRELVDEGQATPVVQFCYGSLLVDSGEEEGLDLLIKALPEFPPPAIKLAKTVVAAGSVADAQWLLDEMSVRDGVLPPSLHSRLEGLAAQGRAEDK
jgi:tetratricopeptide (TPR) repeat protein